MPRETIVPMATERTETVQHLVSQSARPYNAALVPHSVPMLPAATASTQWHGHSRTIYPARVAVVQPGGCGDTIVDSVENERYLGGLTQHVAWRVAFPGTSVAADMMVLMEFGSGITAMSGKLVEAVRRQSGMKKTALTQEFVGHARNLTSLGQESDIMTQSCWLHLTIQAPWGPVQLTIRYIMPTVGGDEVIIGQTTLREELDVLDTMTQLKASVQEACGSQHGAGMVLAARALGEPNAGSVLRAAMAVTAFGLSGGAPDDGDNNFTLMWPSQRPIIF